MNFYVSEDGADSADAGPLRQGAPGPQPRPPARDGGDRVQRRRRQDAAHRAHLQREVGRHGDNLVRVVNNGGRCCLNRP